MKKLIIQEFINLVIFPGMNTSNFLDDVFYFPVITPLGYGFIDDSNDVRNVERLGNEVNHPIADGVVDVG